MTASTPPVPAPEVGFSAERFAALGAYQDDHFWFAGRKELLCRLIAAIPPKARRTLLDIGCGPGLNLDTWRGFADRVYGVEPFANLVGQTRFSEGVSLETGTCAQIPLEDGCIDLALALDVLEHVDDTQALRELARVLRPDGTVIAAVPAMPWLWSYRDEAAGHLRRYTRKGLLALFQNAGFRVEQSLYYQGLLFPVVVASRLTARHSKARRDREDRPSGAINRLFRAINLFEVRSHLRLPFGSSLVLVARKV